jgi:uncharacterized membrane protein YcgQ (UPF0703/DUF1980 family)
VNQTATNGNGTPAVNIPEVSQAQTVSGGPVHDVIDFNIYDGGSVIEIKEKMFIAQTNDIYYNANDYLGKTIKYEGIFGWFDSEGGERYYSVIRYGPGCCGIDANAGFEVQWSADGLGYPDQNDWVEVVGTLEEYEEFGYSFLRLDLDSIKVLPERGAEFVSQ